MNLGTKSIRSKVLLSFFIITIATFALIELFLLEQSYSAVIESFEDELETRASSLASLTFIGEDGKIELDFADEIMPEYDRLNPIEPTAYFLLIDEETGSEIERSHSLENIKVTIPEAAHHLEVNKYIFWDDTVHKKNVRFAATLKIIRPEWEKNEEEYLKLHPHLKDARPDHEYCLFVVGLDKTEIAVVFRAIVKLTVIPLGSGLLLLLAASWLIVSQSLRSLEKLEQDVQSIDSFNLKPVTVPKDHEIAVVATTLNDVILKLKESFDRERRFTSDVAHELRTPISEILTLSEVVLKWLSVDQVEERKNFEDILSAARQMQKVVVKLLTLARSDAGVLKPQAEKVDIKQLVDNQWGTYSQRALEKRITFKETFSEDTTINTDEDLFRTIIDNLFSNAIDYTPTAGSILFDFKRNTDSYSLSVINTVEKFTEDDVSHLFDRFWRKDNVRTPGGNHSGLGLSLVQALAATLGFTIQASLSGPDTLTINLAKNNT